jgi:3'-5' exoribonuclease
MQPQLPLDSRDPQISRLSDLQPRQSADCFVLLASKEKSKTRDGKPYYRVTLRDAKRATTSMIWSDSTFFPDCDANWQPGQFYKVRGRYQETDFGPQFDLEKIRPIEATDEAQGFRAGDLVPATRFNVEEMFTELVSITSQQITEVPLRKLVIELLMEHQHDIRQMAAAAKNHHAFTGGYLEHVLSVTRLALHFADKYADYYPDLQPPLSKSLVIAGAILHDIGKVHELKYAPSGSTYTAAGRLVGHIFIGRDMIRDKARAITDLNPETLLRLEHIIISHQSLPEWGSPIPPSTPEALLVAEADNLDAKFHEMAATLMIPPTPGEEFTTRDNPLRRGIFRGLADTPTQPDKTAPAK